MRGTARKRIDWTAMRATLQARADAAAATASVDAARNQRLLADRTRALATPARSTAPRVETRALILSVGTERYALPLAAAREVVSLQQIAVLPGVATTVLGIASWRGAFVVVFDLAGLVGATRTGRPRCAVVLSDTEPPLAIAIDAADSIASTNPDALNPPQTLAPERADLFRGSTPAGLMVFNDAALRARLMSEL